MVEAEEEEEEEEDEEEEGEEEGERVEEVGGGGHSAERKRGRTFRGKRLQSWNSDCLVTIPLTGNR